MKKGEVLEIGPEGKRGVWRNVGGTPIFIEVQKGESVPEAVKRETGAGEESSTSTGEKGKEFDSFVCVGVCVVMEFFYLIFII